MVQTRAGPTLPAKQETSLRSAGVEAGEQVCRGAQDTATGTRPGMQSTRVKRTAGNNSLGTRKPRLGHRRAGVKAPQAQALRHRASISEGPWQGRCGPGLRDQGGLFRLGLWLRQGMARRPRCPRGRGRATGHTQLEETRKGTPGNEEGKNPFPSSILTPLAPSNAGHHALCKREMVRVQSKLLQSRY